MKLNPYYRLLLLVLYTCVVFSSRQVEDFTYSQFTISELKQQRIQIRVSAQRSILSRYEFPNTWDISQFLSESLQKETPLPQISNIGGEISFIKTQIADFLKLSHKADLLVKNIQELPQMRNDLTLIVKEEELNVIEAHEVKLRALNDQIDVKGLQLQKIVQEIMIQQENPLFKEAALSFEKKALTQKIRLLNELMVQAESGIQAQKRKSNEQRLQNYFSELTTIFKTESGLIDAIDTLLKNHNELTVLKARVTSLTSQLKAHQLTLAEKQECHQEFKSIKQKQRQDRETIKLVETLKLKKLQFNQPNKYCEGVVQKLIDRIKKLLIGYDYVYECAQELQHTRQNTDKVRQELEEAQRKLHQLQLSRGVEEFRKTFENNRAVIANKVTQLKTLHLDDFYRYPSLIQTAIAESQQKIKEIEYNIANLPVKSGYDLASAQHLIKDKVNQIKMLKAQYCEENQLYNQNSEIIQNRISKLQQQEEYNDWIRNLEIQKLQQLENTKTQMKYIQTTVLAHLV